MPYVNDSTAKNNLLEYLRKRSAQKAAESAQKVANAQQQYKHIPITPVAPEPTTHNPSHKRHIILNQKQNQAAELARQGKSFCLIGAAGTGKTTTVKEIARFIVQNVADQHGGKVPEFSIALLAFTNRAVNNMAKAVAEVAEEYCSTIHKFLRFHPEKEAYTKDDGTVGVKLTFVPLYHSYNPLPQTQYIIAEESSMLGTRLCSQLADATPNAKFIFLGDLNQLMPIYDKPILGFALNNLPVIELTEVYRQALESPIIWFQHNYTLKGKLPSDAELRKISEGIAGPGLHFHPFKSEPSEERQSIAIARYMHSLLESGEYDPDQDMILVPFNKGLGTLAINLEIAERIAVTEQKEVYEVYTGTNNLYLAVGDRILADKEECIITDIQPNPSYVGKAPHPPSAYMSRYGWLRKGAPQSDGVSEILAASAELAKTVDFSSVLESTAADKDETIVRQASHRIFYTPIAYPHSEPKCASTQGDVAAILFSYALTVHKAQGSEWRKVWFILSKKHRNMLTREMLYTGMTRAKEELTVFYSPQTRAGKKDNAIARCISRPAIPGTGWEEKAQHFLAQIPQAHGDIADFNYGEFFRRIAG